MDLAITCALGLRVLAPARIGATTEVLSSSSTSQSTKRYACNLCEKSYLQRSSLGRHKKYRHCPEGGGLSRFKCKHCGETFQRPEGPRNHVAKNSCAVHVLNNRFAHQRPLPPSGRSCTVASGMAFRSLQQLDEQFHQRPTYGYPPPPWYTTLSYSWGEPHGKEDCGKRRSPFRHSFPHDFDLPPPRDLEDLIREQSREKRRLYVLQSFKATHRKLEDINHTSTQTEVAALDAGNRARVLRHLADSKHAWRNGMSAARQVLRGTLPRELHTILGVTQLASAIRAAVDDIDSPFASESKFLADLGRWRQLLPSSSHEAFDYCADIMWDYRLPSDLAWSELQDVETLVYFQDQLSEMLSLIESSPLEVATPELTICSSDTFSHAPSIVSTLPSRPNSINDQIQPVEAMPAGVSTQDEPMPLTLGEVVLYSAGAIFALILTFLMRKS
jgi:hypothetical protein